MLEEFICLSNECKDCKREQEKKRKKMLLAFLYQL